MNPRVPTLAAFRPRVRRSTEIGVPNGGTAMRQATVRSLVEGSGYLPGGTVVVVARRPSGHTAGFGNRGRIPRSHTATTANSGERADRDEPTAAPCSSETVASCRRDSAIADRLHQSTCSRTLCIERSQKRKSTPQRAPVVRPCIAAILLRASWRSRARRRCR